MIVFPRFFISPRNLKKFSLNSSSVGVVRKNQRKPREVRSGEVESAFKNGVLSRSAAWLAVAVTLELYEPITATTFSCEMSRSASESPFSGDDW